MVNVIKKNTHTHTKKNVLCQNLVCRPFKSQAITRFCIYFLFLGYALKCNYCLSFVGWEECRKNYTVTCRFPKDHCGTAYVKWIVALNFTNFSAEVFIKNCTDPFFCNKKLCNVYREIPSIKKIINCEIRCCQGDLCNRYQESQNGSLVPSTKIIPGKNWTK